MTKNRRVLFSLKMPAGDTRDRRKEFFKTMLKHYGVTSRVICSIMESINLGAQAKDLKKQTNKQTNCWFRLNTRNWKYLYRRNIIIIKYGKHLSQIHFVNVSIVLI